MRRWATQSFFHSQNLFHKMEPLPTTKRVLIWLSMHPDDSGSSSKWKRMSRIVAPRALFLFLVFVSPSFLVFISKFASTRMGDCIFSILGFTVSFGTLIIIIFAYFLRHQTPILFGKLNTIYSDSEWILNSINSAFTQNLNFHIRSTFRSG